MYTTVIQRQEALPEVLRALLPPRLLEEIDLVLSDGRTPEEIRLRRERAASLVVNGENVRLCTVLSEGEMEALLHAFCGGSLYAHEQTLCQGYISLADDLRIGVCGRANVVGGRVIGVSQITGFAIRLPAKSPLVGEVLAERIRRDPTSGMLIFAPPAVGKTTLLRALARTLCEGQDPLRVAVVDTRGELSGAARSQRALIDILAGYPRGTGISIAARTLSPELIVCDEIGDEREVEEILSANSCGIPLLASAHGDSLAQLLRRPPFAKLHRAMVFGTYVRIRRHRGAFDFLYEITDWEAADALA